MKATRRIVLSAALTLTGGICLRAQSSKDVTIVYDVQAREFRCWYEGDRRVPDCSAGSHPFYQGIHFYAGQAVYLQYKGAHVSDLFALSSTATDLPEPTVPIFGAGVPLPAISKLAPPAGWIAAAPSVKAVAAPRSELSNLAGTLDRLNNADFTNLVQSALLAVVATDQAGRAVIYASSGALEALSQVTGRIPAQATAIAADVTKLMGDAPQQLGWLRGRYCFPPNSATGAPDPAVDFPIYNDRLLELAQLMSRQAALVQQAVAVDIRGRAAEVVTQITAYQDPAMGVFSSQVAKALEAFAKQVRASGYLQAPSTIGNIALVNGKYAPAPPGSLLAAVNESVAGLRVDDTTLGQLRDNLKTLVSRWTAIEDAIKRYGIIADYADRLEKYKGRSDNIFRVQAELNEVSRLLIEAGAAANCIAQGMPLPEPFDRPSLGTWYSSQTIALEIKRGTRLPAYDLSGIETTTQTSITRDAATAKAVTSPPQEASTSVAKTTFQIHGTYHLQLAAGFMRSCLRDVKYQVFQRTVTVSGSSTTENFFAQTRGYNYRFLATANLIYYPFKREFFPWRARYPGEPRPPRYKELGVLGGFSITDPSKDFFVGGAWVPRTGIGLQAGLHLGFVDATPPVPLGKAITDEVTSIRQKLERAGFVGILMHMQVFRDVVGAIFK